MTTKFLLLFAFFLLFPVSLVSVTEETGAYELDEVLCLGHRGVEVDENCNVIRPAPYSQQESGIKPEQVKCNHDYYRSYKISDGMAFCASGYALKELVNRGYAQAFDSYNSATIGKHNSIVKEYCPASQELIQWGWFAQVRNPIAINTNIDLVYDLEKDSHGVEFSFERKTDGKSMIWVFVECNDFDATFGAPGNRHPAFLGWDIPDVCTNDMVKFLKKYSNMFDKNLPYMSPLDGDVLDLGVNPDDMVQCENDLLDNRNNESSWKEKRKLIELQNVLDSCNSTAMQQPAIGYRYSNDTHYIDNNICEWQELENEN